ncbi:MAG: DNA polymerase I, partial [Chitinispirillales bacterium]|nr:DNA polymerase I [Chitinispirillales bacterium]
PEGLKRERIDATRALALLKELEFFSMMKNPIFGEGKRFEPTVRLVDSVGKLRELADAIGKKGEASIDVVAVGTHPRAARLLGVMLAVDPSEALYVCMGGGRGASVKDGADIDLFGDNAATEAEGRRWVVDRREFMKILAPILASPKIGKVGHDLKYVALALRGDGIALDGIAFDTMLAAYVIDPGKRHSDLSELAREYLGLEIKICDRSGAPNKDTAKDGAFIDPLANEAPALTANSACAALLLRDKLSPIINERNCASLFSDIEIALAPVLTEMEWHGVLIDTELLSRLSTEYAAEIGKVSQEVYDFAGEEFNLNSPKQLAEILFGKLGLKGGKKTKSGSHSTNVEVLEKLSEDYPIVKTILDYREKQKLLSTYIDSLPAQILPQTGRVHTSFNQAITATGRLSSTNPNLQNIPIRTESGRKIRNAFIAPEGSLIVSADYSQIELRILAHLSDDPALVQAFIDGLDIHTQTASAVYGVFPEMVTAEMRRAAKTINFGLMYGMGPMNLSKQLGVSFSDAKDFIESYFSQFPSIRSYMDAAIQNARDRSYSETLLGRRRYLPEINAANRIIRDGAERTAINTPVQGTAADIIKIAMVSVHSKLGTWPATKMLLQVHDELVFETPKESADDFAKWISEEMSVAHKLKVPLKVDAGIGKHWGEAH